MKLILRASVAHLGEPGDLVEVKRGYARNYLLPKGYATQATAANLRAIEFDIDKLKAKAAEQRSIAQAKADRLSQETLAFVRKVVDPTEGSLYGSVSIADVHEAIGELGYKVEKGEIHLDHPVKLLGEFEVVVTVAHGVDANVKFTITGESGETAPEPVEEPEPAPRRTEAAEEDEFADLDEPAEDEGEDDAEEAAPTSDLDDEAAEYAI